jgi:hypothetical protein
VSKNPPLPTRTQARCSSPGSPHARENSLGHSTGRPDLIAEPPPDHARVLGLRPGELVRVRSAREIFSTLDENGRLDGLPFMPEMVAYCGRTFPVFKRADKTCDGTGQLRNMKHAVHLSNVRCDGSAHGGCQAACHMYWKEAWLERVEDGLSPEGGGLDADGQAFVKDKLLPMATHGSSSAPRDLVYQCQATALDKAAARLSTWELDQYVRDVRNWSLRKVVRSLLVAVFNKFQLVNRRLLPRFTLFGDGRSYPFLPGSLEKGQTPSAKLNLQPGDLVRIKSKDEIVKTLDHTNYNRGLSFDVEMVKYCGRTARVRGRVERLIDEQTGKMIHIKSDCIVLDGVICKADYRNRFCTRGIYPYWREIWLEKLP